MPTILIRFLTAFLTTVFFSLPLAAQVPGLSASAETETGSENALAEVIRQASEAGVSVIVVDSSGQLAEAAEAGSGSGDGGSGMESASGLMRAQSEIAQFRETLRKRLEVLPNSFVEVAYILRATSPDGEILTFAKILGVCAVMFFIAYFAMREIYGKRIARRFVMARILENPQGYREKMPFLVVRFLAGVGGTVFGMIVSYIGLYLLFGETQNLAVEFTVSAIFLTFFLARTASDLWRMILSPFLSQYRIPHFSDRDAKRLYLWASTLATYDIITVMFSTWIGDFGLNYNVYAVFYGLMSLVGVFGNVLMVLFNVGAISNAIRGGRPAAEVSWLLRFLSFAWAPAMLVYVGFSWLEMAFDLVLEKPVSVPIIVGSYGVFISIIIVYGAINYAIERYFDRSREIQRRNAETEQDDEEALEEPVAEIPDPFRRHPIATFEDLARRVAGILAFGVGSYALFMVWNPEPAWLNDTVVDRFIDVAVIVFIGYIVFHFFRIWIDSKIEEETDGLEPGELGDEGGATGASRLATLLPLFRGAILAVVVVSIVLIALLELGINVSPLFAGAGVVGLAVGFGAQTLVRDIFSGAFFLIDDAFRKGEYIDIGDVKGTVEKISVRSFQLRHHLGALNTIPFGEIKVLTNYSRDWVIMKLPLRVTYDTDVEKVRKLIKNLGQELLSDPVIGDNFIQPLKSQGVIEMQDSAMIIRVKFMTKPGDQWLVRKKVYQEIRELFAREGIKFAHREVTVRLADEKGAADLTPQQREAVSGAVQAAIDEDYLDDIGPGGDDR
ncbi:mechanosensitive ion channel family protein [Primorskyibacter sp. S87]|uniref:mechanosensitive ion channel family protein n=1 Tax=Primorskyibacter sp. S87 TaxID=3415126 RepID=UPI003C7AD557